ncbi:hypothetical protein [Lentilactobacillus buchneri]|uniref:hypothetical protein n=1 Tax=Lentilactobacillus buchneri TaxID=1581 RepID=UPI001CDC220E|nr:hypothetical protein [Lentilactobacillus buchneri]
MAYDLAKVTANGNNLIAQILANKSSLSIDKIEISDTQLSSTTDISTMTSVPKVVQTVSANGFSKNSNTLIISTVVDNSSISADYKAWVFGIWGSDSQNGQSQLIAVITSTNSPDTIPAFSGSTPVSYTYKFNIGFSNASQIQFNMIDDSFATNDTVVHTTGDETVDGKKAFKVDPVDGAGNAYAKTVDVNQQLDKKVNVSDMRKPASDVAGIEEVNAKQDKIGYTPADDSKVAHLSGANNFDTVPTVKNNPLLLASSLPSDYVKDNFDGTITANGTIFNLLKSLSASSIPQDPTKDYNTLPQGLALMSETNGEPANMPPVKSTYLTLTIASNFSTGRKRQLAWLDAGANSSNNNYTYIRYCVGSTWSSWDSIPTSTQISSLIPSTIADTTKLANFTVGLQSGGVNVATAADLKSVAGSAWYIIPENNNNTIRDVGWMKRDPANKYLYILYNFATVPWVPTSEMLVDLSSYVDALDDARGYIMLSSNDWYSNDNVWHLSDSHRAMSTVWAKGATLVTGSGFNISDLDGGKNYLKLTTFNDNIDNNPWTNKCLRVHYNNWIRS